MDIIRESAGVPQDFTVERNGSLLDLQVTPIAAERYAVAEDGTIVVDSEGNPQTRTVGFIGIAPKIERQQQSPLVAFQSLGDNVAQVGALVLQLPQKVYQVAESAFGNKKRDINGPISVVGVGRIAGEITSSADFDLGSRFAALIGILASLNIALFVFNLLPLLPLDGGHIVVALWEGTRNWIQRLRGKPSLPPLDTAKLVPITVAVTVLLVGVSALLIYADIVKPITL
jgi:membrane-associated protease RseP (regulator of RpoE activity)